VIPDVEYGLITSRHHHHQISRSKLADKNRKAVDQLTNSQDNFGRAKENLFHTIEEVEKKAIHIAENLVQDEVDVLFGKNHGHSLSEKNHKAVDQTKLTPSNQDNFVRVKDNFLHAIVDVEKKALRIAENLVHDEVNILFGKDHGHAIHDEKINPQPIKPVSARLTSTSSISKKNKVAMDVQATTGTHLREKEEPPHALFLDFMENYADNCHYQFGF
jgi:hypothetical protein